MKSIFSKNANDGLGSDWDEPMKTKRKAMVFLVCNKITQDRHYCQNLNNLFSPVHLVSILPVLDRDKKFENETYIIFMVEREA